MTDGRAMVQGKIAVTRAEYSGCGKASHARSLRESVVGWVPTLDIYSWSSIVSSKIAP